MKDISNLLMQKSH